MREYGNAMPVALTIIVPAFNEEASIQATLRDLAEHLPADTEILVIDGGQDRTGERVRELMPGMPGLRHVPHPGDRGKGHAIRDGMRLAAGGIQAQFDSDGQFFARDLPGLIEPIQNGSLDVALGSRFLPSSPAEGHSSILRDFGNAVVSAWLSLLFGRRITDALAGIKAWRKEAVEVIDLQSDGFAYEAEIVARALRRGLRVGEVPVGTRPRAAGDSKVSLMGDGLRICFSILKFRWRK